ncbi:hypothetical protein Q7P35_009976 [Cladosporium inversicolor]
MQQQGAVEVVMGRSGHLLPARYNPVVLIASYSWILLPPCQQPPITAPMSTTIPLSIPSARQTAPMSLLQPPNVRVQGDVQVNDHPIYDRLYDVYALLYNFLRVRLRAFIKTRKGFLGTVVIWIMVDLFVESSDIAQIAQAMQQVPGSQGSAPTGITAWGLFSHSSKIIALVVYLYIEARRPTPVYSSVDQNVEGLSSSQPSAQALSVFLQSGELELGHSERDFVRTHHFPTSHLRLKSRQASTSYTASSPSPLKQAYVHGPLTSSSKAPIHVADNSTASSAPPEQYEMQTFRSHTQLPEEPTRPPPVVTRQHRLPVRSKVTSHDSVLHALSSSKRAQSRRGSPVHHATTPPESHIHPPRELHSIDNTIASPESRKGPPNELHSILKHFNNQAAPDLPSREYTRDTAQPDKVLLTRPSSASPGAEGPPGPVLIRQV